MPRTDEMEVLQKASSVEGIKVPEKKIDEADLKKGEVMCYVNGQQVGSDPCFPRTALTAVLRVGRGEGQVGLHQ